MADRAALLEAVVDCVPEGVAVFGEDYQVAIWNQGAQAITGYAPEELLGRAIPEGLKPLLAGHEVPQGLEAWDGAETGRGALVHARHKLGHELDAMARVLTLRDALGRRIGAAILFHPTESLDALPHGITGDTGMMWSRVRPTYRTGWNRCSTTSARGLRRSACFGSRWIRQANCAGRMVQGLAKPCSARLRKRLTQGLRPAEHLGRWGEDEFLVISHERTPDDAGGTRAGAGRVGADGRLPLVGRPHFADSEHWRGAGASCR